MSDHVIKFVEDTADYTLRECYKRLGSLKLAENAFIEVYMAWYRNISCKNSTIWKILLNLEIKKICKSMKSK